MLVLQPVLPQPRQEGDEPDRPSAGEDMPDAG
jgi:hypothetical protein